MLECLYWQQFTGPGPITLRRGDWVYIKTPRDRKKFLRIHIIETLQSDN